MQVSGTNNSALLNAYQGMQNGFNGLNENSQKIANPSSEKQLEALVDVKLDANQVQASAKAVKAADDAIGTIIDIMA